MIRQKNKGYSLIVLVIAIVVIVILSGVAISSLRTSRQKTAIQNFIFDMNSMEEKVKNYYVLNGSLPTSSKEAVNINEIANSVDFPAVFKSQLSQYDNDNYYYIDLNRLGGIALKEPYRGLNDTEHGYIVNEGSLKVYVKKGVSYQIDGSSQPEIYYTLTSNLVNGQEIYISQDEEIKVAGNPLTWTNKAELRVILPRRSDAVASDWNAWVFKWDFGPKPVEELRGLPTKNTFKYGDKLIVKSNGVYSIYCKEPGVGGKETVLNVNITKIDNIEPKYAFLENGNRISITDNETGIKSIKYKTLAQYKQNVLDAEEIETDNLDARTRNDFFLMDGSGDDLRMQLGAQIIDYATRTKEINQKIQQENEAWQIIQDAHAAEVSDEESNNQYQKRRLEHNDTIALLNSQLLALVAQYPYIADINGTTDNSKLVLYAEDHAGNATTVGVNNLELITTKILADSYNISLAPLN